MFQIRRWKEDRLRRIELTIVGPDGRDHGRGRRHEGRIEMGSPGGTDFPEADDTFDGATGHGLTLPRACERPWLAKSAWT